MTIKFEKRFAKKKLKTEIFVKKKTPKLNADFVFSQMSSFLQRVPV